MGLRTEFKVELIEYVVAPWHLRLRWWLAGRFWCWCRSFEQIGARSPEQAHPLWRKW